MCPIDSLYSIVIFLLPLATQNIKFNHMFVSINFSQRIVTYAVIYVTDGLLRIFEKRDPSLGVF